MKKALTLIFGSLLFSSVSAQDSSAYTIQYYEIEDFTPEDTLFRVPMEEYAIGEDFCYTNQKGDTVIPFGRYYAGYFDTITTYGIMIERSNDSWELFGIDQKGQRLYEVFWFDNGPDYIEDGLFRIERNGKIGYADTRGKIVIEPQYQCAYPFSEGRAQVTYDCEITTEFEFTVWKSDSWFRINKKGQKTE